MHPGAPRGQVPVRLTGVRDNPIALRGTGWAGTSHMGPHCLSFARPPTVHLPSHCPRTRHHPGITERSHPGIRSTRAEDPGGSGECRSDALMLGVMSPSPGEIEGFSEIPQTQRPRGESNGVDFIKIKT